MARRFSRSSLRNVVNTASTWPCGLVATVHDELLLEVAEQDAEYARDILHATMVEAFELTFPDAPTNNLAEAIIGRTWAELK